MIAILVAFGAVFVLSMRRSPRPTAVASPVLDAVKVGKAPSDHIQWDLQTAGRAYSGTSVSNDGGRTWSPLADTSGRRAVLLGGPRAFPPVAGPAGRVGFAHVLQRVLVFGADLHVAGPAGRVGFAHVLFDDPQVPFGHGEIADVVEWNGVGWSVIEDEDSDVTGNPDMNVVHLQFEPSTGNLLSQRKEDLFRFDRGLGEVTSSLITSFGEWLTATTSPYALFAYSRGAAQWLPVPVPGTVRGLAEGKAGSIYVAAGRLGRKTGDAWRWTDWPGGFSPTEFAVHPRWRDWIAVRGAGQTLLISRDGGATLQSVATSGPLTAVSWNPHDNSLWYVVRGGDLFRLRLRP